jgi:hypothetical protein
MTAEETRYKENKDYREGWDAGFQKASQGNINMWGKARQAGYDEGKRVGYTQGYSEALKNSQYKPTTVSTLPVSELRARIKQLDDIVRKQYKKIRRLEKKKEWIK